jgi:thiopurine S-methyltransferase
MDKEFWTTAWKEGRTAFHQPQFNEKLLKHFPTLGAKEGQKVLVPLCGKTKDLIWLAQEGLEVHGVEFYEAAVKDFFKENDLDFVREKSPDFIQYSHRNILISCGDFFKLPKKEYDFIYDRASLVALPEALRRNYAEIIRSSLRSGGKCLLVVYDYDQEKMEGPPFSVSEKEIRSLYSPYFELSLLETESMKQEGTRLSSVEGLEQKVYCLVKK